jgi:hypothetical protein
MSRKRVCHGCTVETGRSPTCHQTCERYLAEKAEDALDKEIDEIERGVRGYQCERKYKKQVCQETAILKRNRFKNRT